MPGVHIMLPSRRGDVCLTPLFLNRQQLDSTAAALQDLIVPDRQDAPAGGAVAGVLQTIAPSLTFICRISPGIVSCTQRRVIRPIDRRMYRMAIESVAAELMGRCGRMWLNGSSIHLH